MNELIQELQAIAKRIRALPGGDTYGKRSEAETCCYAAAALLADLAALQQQQSADDFDLAEMLGFMPQD